MFLSYYLNLDSTNRFMSANIISIYLHLRLTISIPATATVSTPPPSPAPGLFVSETCYKAMKRRV